MRIPFKTVSILVVLFVLGIGGYVAAEESRYGIYYQNQMTSHMLVNLFFQEIDNGELVIFEKTITREMIEPTQIAYIYSFNKDTLTISIYSRVKEKLLIPHFEDFFVDGISINVDEQGNIKEVKSHVVAK